jgi:THUMP domain-like
MDVALFRSLLSPAGQEVLAQACEEYDERSAVSLSDRLRRRHPAELVPAAMTQAALRRRARTKWGEAAGRMYFTRDGLEQATTGVVAAYRAERIVSADLPAATPTPADIPAVTAPAAAAVADLCCGIGSDLLALVGAGCRATGFDRDPLTVEMARANLAAFGWSDRGGVEVADATTVDRSSYAAVTADPARRADGRRVFDVAAFSPPWSFVTGLLRDTACVKTTPILPHRLIPDGVEAEWISAGGEVREVALWSGALRTTADRGHVRRRATVLAPTTAGPKGPGVIPAAFRGSSTAVRGQVHAAVLTDADQVDGVPLAAPSSYVYEPDNAVVGARLVAALAPLVDGSLLHKDIAYLTSDRLVHTPLATAYLVTAVLPYDLKKLRSALRTRDVGPLTIKKRGVDISPEVVRRRLGLRGSKPATLILTPTGTGTVALLVERAGEPPAGSPDLS